MSNFWIVRIRFGYFVSKYEPNLGYLHTLSVYVAVSGRRSCLGELLAQQEIYLFLAALVQNFIIKPPEGCDDIVCGEKVSVTVAPEHFTVRFLPRSYD